MPRFFFHRADGSVEHDLDGTELPNIEAARLQAVALAGASLADNPEQIWPGENFRVTVRDEQGKVVFTVLTTAIEGPLESGPS